MSDQGSRTTPRLLFTREAGQSRRYRVCCSQATCKPFVIDVPRPPDAGMLFAPMQAFIDGRNKRAAIKTLPDDSFEDTIQ
jgi:hypothetical protein